MYSAGLRIAEVCRLRYNDIDRKHMRIHICHTKARSDRYAILSQMALSLLTGYWFAYDRPRGWLFPKQSRREDPRPINTFYLSRHIHAHERELGWEDFSSSFPPRLPESFPRILQFLCRYGCAFHQAQAVSKGKVSQNTHLLHSSSMSPETAPRVQSPEHLPRSA